MNQMRVQSDGTILVEATVPVRELNRDFELELSSDDATVGDLVAARCRGTLRTGRRIAADDGSAIEIVAIESGRIAMVRIHRRRDS